MRFLKVGGTAVGAVLLAMTATPALAQQQPAPMQLSKSMVGPMNEARNAILAKDWVTAKAKLTAAEGQAKTPQDKLALERLRIAMAAETKDYPQQITSLEAMLGSGLLTPAETKTYKGALSRAYLDSGDQAKSTQVFRAYIDEFGGTPEQYIGLANDAAKAGDSATAVTYANKAIDAVKATGAKPADSWYRVLMKAYKQANEMDKYYATEERALADNPAEQGYWRELIARVQTMPGFGAEQKLDMFRTLTAAGVKLSPTEKRSYATEALKRGMPNETLQVLEPAFAAGELGSEAEDQKTMRDAKTAATEDKAGLAKETADALAKGTSSAIAKIGEAQLSYGDNAKAIEVLQKALDKGVSVAGEADAAKLHLGIAQFRAGQADAAKATWAGITAGIPGVLAHNWVLIATIKR